MFDLDRFRIFISLHTEQRKGVKKANGFKNVCPSLINSLVFAATVRDMQDIAAVSAKIRACLMFHCREFNPKYLCPF